MALLYALKNSCNNAMAHIQVLGLLIFLEQFMVSPIRYDTYITGNAYLLDWYEQIWTELPQMTVDKTWMSCGLINNPENGIWIYP